MTAKNPGEWWDPASSAFDRDRTRRLRDALMALIERDVAFSRDAMVLAYHYPDDVTLGIEIVEPDDAGDEDRCDDWFFVLEGPAFKVVLMAVGRADAHLEDRNVAILRSDVLDQVEGESAALQWLIAPPMPKARGYL